MKLSIFIGVGSAVVVSVAMGFAAMINASNNQWERTEQAFREACGAVNGKAVWNNKYWECLK